MSVATRAVKAAAMRADKSGTQVVTAGVWTKILSWAPNGSYPDTVIANDSVVMNGSDVGAVTFFGTLQSNFASTTFQAYLNGAAIGSAAAINTTGTVTGVTVGPGDTLDLYVMRPTGAGTTATRTVDTGTYIGFTPN